MRVTCPKSPEGPSVMPGPRHHGDRDPVMGDQDPTHTGTEEVVVILQQLQQGLLSMVVIGSRVFVKQVDQG